MAEVRKSVTKTIHSLFENMDYSSDFKDVEHVKISAVTDDSRKVAPGSIFVAVKGGEVDGHDFVDQAIKQGCAAVVVEKSWVAAGNQVDDAPYLEVTDSRTVFGTLAARLHGNPAKRMTLIGITGTNGKTTTTYILESIIKKSGGKPGVIGTINYRYDGKEIISSHTTPGPAFLQETLQAMSDSGVTHVVMEVSSHALDQKRLVGVMFDLAVFTNLTHDHLDYHKSMEEYYCAKKKLFQKYMKDGGQILVLCDKSHDENNTSWADRLVSEMTAGKSSPTSSGVFTCGIDNASDIWVKLDKADTEGLSGTIFSKENKVKFQSSLVGDFNLRNILCAVGSAVLLGIDDDKISQGVQSTKTVPGRMERVYGSGECGASDKFAVFVDYAHTPDALENVLKTLNKIKSGQLIVVFGCGGDRDHSKRFMMGEIAGRLADSVIVTADNSRSEQTERIMEEICKGIDSTGKKRVTSDQLNYEQVDSYTCEADRSKAIKLAVNNAGVNDIVLISGKGHENYQITREGTQFFDDRLEVRKNLTGLH